MKVLNIINNLGSGGAEKLLVDVLPILKEKGHEVELLLLTGRSSKDEYISFFSRSGISVSVLSEGSVYNPFLIFKLRKYLKADFDIIHCHLFPVLYFVSIGNLFFKNHTKILFTEHNTHNRRIGKFYLRGIEKLIYSSFDHIIAISDPVKENLKQWLNLSSKSISTVYNGIDINQIEKAKFINISKVDNLRLNGNMTLLMVASFSEQKDHKTVIKALLSLPKYNLLLIGEGPRKNELVDYCKNNKIDDRVHFLGFKSNAIEYMKSVDCCILSSFWEGFGLSAIECMASGTPTIISDVSGLSDIVGKGALKFKPGDHVDLFNKIKSFEKNKNLRVSIVNEAKLQVLNYTVDKMVKNLLRIYARILTV